MALTIRARLYVPLVDEAGELLLYARVRIYEEDGVTPFAGKIFRDGTSTKTFSNPFVASPALVAVYFQKPMRVRLGIQLDTSKPEVVGDVIDVLFDADQTVDTVDPLTVVGDWSVGGLLCGLDADTAFWKPLRVDHEHAMIAPETVLTGPIDHALAQAGDFPGCTVIGADSGGWGASSSLNDASMLGAMANGYGRGTTAIGKGALAEEGADPPWPDGSTAVGRDSTSDASGVALGSASVAGSLAVAAGRSAQGSSEESVALGRGAKPFDRGVAIGRDTGSQSSGMPGSIGLGAGAQYGLPSSTDSGDTSVLLGAYDPTRARTFPWANPHSSQSESPFNEYSPTMSFTGRTIQLQRGLEWLANITKLQVSGNATLGGIDGLLGFYGQPAKAQAALSDDEPSSGNTALDNLIFALRDLNLLRYRTEASVTYRAADMGRTYLEGDPVASWVEHFGTDTALTQSSTPPRYRAADESFNGQPTVGFANSVYRRSTRPVQELRGKKLLPTTKHYVVVASHSGDEFGLNEGLFNLAFLTKVVSDDASVLSAEGFDDDDWSARNISRYEVNRLNQTNNMDARIPGPNVYAVTDNSTWPHARPVIGGPRDNDNAGWDRWSGQIAEIVGMDPTWETSHVQSMAAGLAFKYGIAQDDDWLEEPSEDFIRTQHDPMNGTLVFWTRDYSNGYIGKVRGRATRVPKPVIYIPFCSIYIAFAFYFFRGCLVGNWGNLFFAEEYEVLISIKIGDLDGDGDIDVDVDFDVETESQIGIFSLNNNFTWSMGRLSSRIGYKICRIRHRITKEVICLSGDQPFRYQDTDVKIYSTNSSGALVLEQTVPLWGDGTFKAWIKHPGKKVARVVEHSTGNVLGTTEYQEKALPRTQLYADDDPEQTFTNRDLAWTYESALTALSMLEMDPAYWYRARHILITLQLVCNDDGSLNESYSAVLPAKAARPMGASPERWGAAWAILAVLRYGAVTGDGQFLPFARKVADFMITDTITSTRDLAAAYFAYRDLAAVTGVSTYATAASNARTALLGSCWTGTPGRWKESTTSDSEALWADVMGGLFALAIGDQAKARATVRHLKRFRVKNASISAPHYSGPSGLIGYKPYADAGSSPHTNPPTIIDQAGTWAAILFKLRYGEPAGDDVNSLFRWAQTVISSDPTHDLYSAQFLRYNQNATTSPYSFRARPHLAPACWGQIMANGARALFLPDPLPVPVVISPTLSVTFDAVSGRDLFRYTWQIDPTIPSTAFEAVPELSINGGTSWSPVSVASIQAPLIGAADASVGTNGYSATWSSPPPENPATIYRVRIRIRNASFGSWATSPTVALP